MIRKTAENWRTGMAGLTALVTASLLFHGGETASWNMRNGYVIFSRYWCFCRWPLRLAPFGFLQRPLADSNSKVLFH